MMEEQQTTFCILLDSSPAFDSMDFNTAAVWFYLI